MNKLVTKLGITSCHFPLMLTSCLAVIYFCSYFFFWPEQVATHHFTMRDFKRALDLLQGTLIWHGPDLNFGGFLPGPALYYLLSIALFFVPTIEMMIAFAYGLAACSAAILFLWIWKISNIQSAFIAFTLFSTSNIFGAQMQHMWNPTFAFIFNILIAILFFDAFLNNKKKSLYFAFLFIGFAVQFHLSMFYHLLTCVALSISFKGQNQLILGKTCYLKLLGILILPLLPYFIWLSVEYDINTIYAFLSAQKDYQLNFSNIYDKFFRTLRTLEFGIFINPIVLFFAIHTLSKFDKNTPNLKVLRAIAFVYLAHLLFNFPITQSKLRYLMVFQVYNIIFYSIFFPYLISAALSLLRPKTLLKKFYEPAIISICILITIYAFAKDREKQYLKLRVHTNYSVKTVKETFWNHLLSDYLKISADTLKETNWSPVEFQDRVYHIVSSSFEIGTIYQHLYTKQSKRSEINQAPYSGLVIFPYKKPFKRKYLGWLKKIGVPPNTLAFFKDPNVKIVKERSYHNLMVLYYRIDAPHLHNYQPRNMGVTFQPRKIENAINSTQVKPNGSSIDYDSEYADIFAVWDFGAFKVNPRRFALSINFHESENSVAIEAELNAKLLRLTYPSYDSPFDQLFIGGLKIVLSGENYSKSLKFPKILGEPFVRMGSIRLKYAPFAFPGQNIKSLATAVSPVRRSIDWPCDQKLLSIELLADDILVMRNFSKIIDNHLIDQKLSINLSNTPYMHPCSK